MAGERRTDRDIRREMAAEREQLAEALADLRRDIGERRRTAILAGGTLAVSVAAAAAVALARRRRRRRARRRRPRRRRPV